MRRRQGGCRGSCCFRAGVEVRVAVSWGVRDGDRGKFEGRYFSLLSLCVSGGRCTPVGSITWDSGLVCMSDWVCIGLGVGKGRCATYSVGFF